MKARSTRPPAAVLWCLSGWLAVGVASREVPAQDFTRVPGVVIDYQEAPTLPDKLANVNEIYIASPSITVMPNGYYVASHDLFDSGTNYDTTKVFLSTDRGATWSHRATIVGQFWSTVFEHRGDLYLFGPERQGGNLIARKSTDYGRTWTEPTGPTTGLIREGRYGGTPNAPVLHGGRIWIAQGGTRVASAPADADLLRADSWHVSAPIPDRHAQDYFAARWQGWSEAQAVASPQTGVVLMPKIRALPRTALLQVDEATGEMRFDGAAPNAFPSLPGGEKKFGARYDRVSRKFFVLSNPVLPLEANHPGLADKPEMIRNSAGVLSSRDLVHWNVEKLFLYSPNLDDGTFGEGFQYFNFVIDGDDLAVVARTAIDVGDGQNRPPRGHDTNLMTFHRIEDFRNLSPDHVLVADGKSVWRFEQTQHKRAPLGPFALGSAFAGAPLTEPVALAQAADSDVYIRERSGRVLRFDAAGNFIDAVTRASSVPSEVRASLLEAPESSLPTELRVAQPPKGHCTWTAPGSGEWFVPTNWYYWGRADGADEVAVFGSAAVADSTVVASESFTIKGIRFRGDAAYTIEGPGRLTIAATEGAGVLAVERGDHHLRVAIELACDTDLRAESGASLTLGGPFALNGHRLEVRGPGRVDVGGRFSMGKGVLAVHDRASLSFAEGVGATLDGTLLWVAGERVALEAGKRFPLIGGMAHAGARFDEVVLPEPPEGLLWDTSSLYRDGTITLTNVGKSE